MRKRRIEEIHAEMAAVRAGLHRVELEEAERDPSCFYHTARWRRLRKHRLIVHPLCKYCLADGKVAPATVVDHVVPIAVIGPPFCTGALQSLCDKSTKERRGYRTDVGLDGLPIDPNHPFNRAGQPKRR